MAEIVGFFARFKPLKRHLKTSNLEKINRLRGRKMEMIGQEKRIFTSKTMSLPYCKHAFDWQFTCSRRLKACMLPT